MQELRTGKQRSNSLNNFKDTNCTRDFKTSVRSKRLVGLRLYKPFKCPYLLGMCTMASWFVLSGHKSWRPAKGIREQVLDGRAA